MTPTGRVAFRAVSTVILLACLSTGHIGLAACYAFLWAFNEGDRYG